MTMEQGDRHVEEPEVLPPADESSDSRLARFFRRLTMAFGPIVAGLLIDTIDFMTLGRLGIMLGMLIGGSAAYWVASIYRLPIWQRLIWALLAGLYCTAPRTEFIPAATLMVPVRALFNPGGAGRN